MTSTFSSGFVDEIGYPAMAIESVTPQLYYTSESGYSQIYQVRRLGRIQLLKTLRPEYRGQEFYEQALYKEFSIGYQLQHEHICRIEGWEHVEGMGNCIVMEYIDGGTLEALMQSGRLTKEHARRILVEIAQALKYLHSKQILHRDLKPQNVMVTHRGGYVKLIDFSLSDSDDSYLLKMPAGTPFYLAPEVREGSGEADCRSDIYSLGIIMSEMVRQTDDKRLRAIAECCSRSLPQERYQTAEEVISALEGVRSGRSLWWGVACVAAIALFWWALDFSFSGSQGEADEAPAIMMGKGNMVVEHDLLLNDSLKSAP